MSSAAPASTTTLRGGRNVERKNWQWTRNNGITDCKNNNTITRNKRLRKHTSIVRKLQIFEITPMWPSPISNHSPRLSNCRLSWIELHNWVLGIWPQERMCGNGLAKHDLKPILIGYFYVRLLYINTINTNKKKNNYKEYLSGIGQTIYW